MRISDWSSDVCSSDLTSGAAKTVDARGTTVAPGLIDSHVHPVFGDWTPRQSQLNWIESFLNGGVTTMISAGEVHLPGRPKDIVGLKALAITVQRAFPHMRPAGVTAHSGTPGLAPGLVTEDFKKRPPSSLNPPCRGAPRARQP